MKKHFIKKALRFQIPDLDSFINHAREGKNILERKRIVPDNAALLSVQDDSESFLALIGFNKFLEHLRLRTRSSIKKAMVYSFAVMGFRELNFARSWQSTKLPGLRYDLATLVVRSLENPRFSTAGEGEVTDCWHSTLPNMPVLHDGESNFTALIYGGGRKIRR